MKEQLSVFSGILCIFAVIPYAVSIVRGKTKPAKASWLIWAGVNTIILIGMVAAGTLNGQIVGATAGCWIITALSLRFGVPGWTVLDRACLAGAVLGVVLWALSRNPVLAIVTSLAVVSLGTVPTLVASWHNPEREHRATWIIFWTSSALATIAIPQWTVADAGQPLTFLALETSVIVLLFLPRRS